MAGSSQEDNASALAEYCKAQGIYIHAAIEPRAVPDAGLGIYSAINVKPGEKLVQVPIKHIFTTESIPFSFLPESSRTNLAVHAQLAAFFAYGDEQDLQQYEAWRVTWPKFSDFTDSMPIFWGHWAEYILYHLSWTSHDEEPLCNRTRRGSKRRKLSTDSEHKDRVIHCKTPLESQTSLYLSPALSGTTNIVGDMKPNGLLQKMADKLVTHIKSIAQALPHLQVIESNQQLVKIFHAWCLVNTRCFYYVPRFASPAPKKRNKHKTPDDPNEAMALCPFMDLFNHRPPANSPETFGYPAANSDVQLPCKVKCTSVGFQITTESSIRANSEVLLSYGAHTNDTLWSEYGFLLSTNTNTSDSIQIDEFVLKDFKITEKATLEENGYFGDYTLHNDGSLCYRTEMAAWLLVLGTRKWVKVVSEGLDPEEACTAPTGKTKFAYTLRLWLEKLVNVAMENSENIAEFDEDAMKRHFRTMTVVTKVYPETELEQDLLAKRRQKMCIARWDQIKEMATRGLHLSSEN